MIKWKMECLSENNLKQKLYLEFRNSEKCVELVNKLPTFWYFLKLSMTYSYLMGLKKGWSYHFLVNIWLCPHQVVPPVKIMPCPFFHELCMACGTTCDKVPMAKMITVKDLIIISHLYHFFLMKNGMHLQLPLKMV